MIDPNKEGSDKLEELRIELVKEEDKREPQIIIDDSKEKEGVVAD